MASGNNLDNVHTDVDLTNARNIGYIRMSITAGGRFGILHKNIKKWESFFESTALTRTNKSKNDHLWSFLVL